MVINRLMNAVEGHYGKRAPFKRPYGVWMGDVFFLLLLLLLSCPSISSKTEEITSKEGSKKRRRLIFPFTRWAAAEQGQKREEKEAVI